MSRLQELPKIVRDGGSALTVAAAFAVMAKLDAQLVSGMSRVHESSLRVPTLRCRDTEIRTLLGRNRINAQGAASAIPGQRAR